MSNKLIKTVPELEITIEINYLNSVQETIDIDYFILALKDSCNQTSKYVPNLFKGLKIVIWDKDRTDIPRPGIGDFGGLTTEWSNLIELKTSVLDNQANICHALGHEMGHYFAKRIGFDNEQSIFRQEWNKLRMADCWLNNKKIITPSELVAEDCRLLFGAFHTNGFQRWDSKLGRYKQANEVHGYRDLFLIWKKSEEVIKKGQNGYRLKSAEFIYSSLDTNYCGIRLTYSRSKSFLWFNWESSFDITLDRNNILKF